MESEKEGGGREEVRRAQGSRVGEGGTEMFREGVLKGGIHDLGATHGRERVSKGQKLQTKLNKSGPP